MSLDDKFQELCSYACLAFDRDSFERFHRANYTLCYIVVSYSTLYYAKFLVYV